MNDRSLAAYLLRSIIAPVMNCHSKKNRPSLLFSVALCLGWNVVLYVNIV